MNLTNYWEHFFSWTAKALGFADCLREASDGSAYFCLDNTKEADTGDVLVDSGGGDEAAGNLRPVTETMLLEAALALLVVSASSFDRRVVRVFTRHGVTQTYTYVLCHYVSFVCFCMYVCGAFVIGLHCII